MGLIVSVYARLSRHDAVRAQVLAHLFLARLHNSIRSSYERSGGFARESTGRIRARDIHRQVVASAALHREHHRQPEGSALAQLTRRKQGNERWLSSLPDDDDNNNNNNNNMRQEPAKDRRRAARVKRAWDWQGFPVEWRPLVVYEWISISWMIWASVRTIFQRQVNALAGPASRWLLDGRPGNCLLIGRMVLPTSMSDHFALLVATYHLGWRFVQRRARRSHLITMVMFLLASERDLERVYAEIESCTTRGGGDTRRASFDRADDYSNELIQTRLAGRMGSRQPGVQWSDAPLQTNERLFCQVMCYQVHRDQQVYFRLRPNRTRAARKLLERRMAAVSLATSIFFALEFAVALILVSTCICSDYRYARTYPGCDPLLDARLARGELTFFSSFSLRGHHLASGCADFFESFILWVDSGLSLTYVPAFCYLLNYDLLLYWSDLNRKLESLARRSKCAHMFQVKLDTSYLADGIEADSPSPPPPLFRLASTQTLECEIHELQFEMFDFFHQVRRVDLIVGDTLTHAILIWLTACAFVYYSLLTYDKSSLYISVIIQLILILGFFVISLATFHLLELRRCCLRSYRTLCTLMAYDRTSKKRQFITLMDFYLGTQSATTYHLFRSYAYEPTTFITIIGWTFSCFFIAAALLKPHQSLG